MIDGCLIIRRFSDPALALGYSSGVTDSMHSAVRWLRVSYIGGAVADGLVGCLMLLPGRMGETGFTYSMGLGASLMFGWTALLIWANRKPVERKGVLLLTIFPVITGLVATGVWAGASGFFPVSRVVPTTVLGVVLIILLGFSYRKAKIAEGRTGSRG